MFGIVNSEDLHVPFKPHANPKVTMTHYSNTTYPILCVRFSMNFPFIQTPKLPTAKPQ